MKKRRIAYSRKSALLVAVIAMTLSVIALDNPLTARAQSGTPSTDRAALIALYNATDGDNWTNKENWTSTQPIGEWYGVTTDSEGRVTRLHLEDNNLTGVIPTELANLSNLMRLVLWDDSLTGTIPTELSNLSNLTDLALSGGFAGAVPNELGRLQNLRSLQLNGAGLTGSIPTELGNLSNLGLLSLQINRFTGSIPVSLCNLIKLEVLIISYNELTGEIPSCLGELSNLIWLLLEENQLTGRIPPELGQLSNLQDLSLHNNRLTGRIPAELGNLPNLQWLSVSENQLTGTIPPQLGNLSSLTAMHISGNQLTGCIPAALRDVADNDFDELGLPFCETETSESTPAPVHAGDKAALVALYNATDGDNWVDKHNWLSDEPLGEWQGVTTDDEGRVTELQLWENNLSGTVPSDLGNLSHLNLLALQDNQITGTIPLGLGSLSNLRELVISSNQLTGAIPSEFGNLSNLTILDLDSNQLSGEIPSALGNLSSLQKLDLSANDLSGAIPAKLGNLSNLTILNVHTNQLSGEIPAELGRLSSLEELILLENQLTGEIPAELGNLSNLTVMYMWENQLSGEIPIELGNLSNLTELALQDNQLTGMIPAELGNLTGLRHLALWGNQMTGSIPPELGRLSSLEELWLGENQLSGPIPPELGNLSSLTELLLDGNQLSGEIPPTLGDLSNLTELYIHDNQLSGTIPLSFTGLTSLEDFYFDSNAGLCAPDNSDFQSWLQAIPDRDDGPNCETPSTTLWQMLAHKYAPMLRMHPDEIYLPKGVEALVEQAVLTYQDPNLQSKPVVVGINLTADMLAPHILAGYRDSLPEELRSQYDGANWYMDIPGPDYRNTVPATDYPSPPTRMDGTAYPPKVYATIRAHIPGKIYLQYYLFYFYDHLKPGFTQDNCEAIGIPICQPHEADWELIQLQFEASSVAEALNGPPSRLAYSQHGWSEDSAYEDIPTVGGHPAAYVAHGKHANYYGPDPNVTAAGTSDDPWRLSISQDQISDRGKTLLPSTLSNVYGDHCPSDEAGRILACTYTYQLELIDETTPWVAYEGGWGDSKLHGPDHPYRWDTPHDWMTNANHPPVGGIEWTEGVLANLNLEDKSGGQRDSAILNAAFYHWFFPRPVPNRNFPIPEWSRALIPSDPHARVTEFEYSNRKTLLEPYFFNSHYPRTIPPLFGDLSHLQKLDIRGNDLTGSIPRQLGYLSNLRELYLNDNNLSGEIPFLLGVLPNLETLYLAGSELTGCIPDGLKDVDDNDFHELGLNFCDGTTVTVQNQPDLAVKSVSTSDGSVELGQGFTLNITVENDGNGTSQQTTLNFYRSSNSRITPGFDDELGTLTVRSLAPGEEVTLSTFVTPQSGGRYYYGACIDEMPGDPGTPVDCRSGDSVTVTTTSPKLKAKLVSTSDRSVELGQGFTLNITVENDGNGTSQQTTLNFYRSSNSRITPGFDDELGTLTVRSLAPGEEVTLSTFVTPQSVGRYYYGACIDEMPGDPGTPVDCRSGDSVTVTTTSPKLKAKLVSTSDRSVELGQGFTLNITVENDGNGTSQQTTLNFYRSSNSRITPGFDDELGTLTVRSLAPGEEVTLSTFVTPQSGGRYYYGACIDEMPGDPGTPVDCRSGDSVTVTTTSPKLKAKLVSTSDRSVELGQGFTLNITVENDGNGTSQQTTLNFYRSSNSRITPGFDDELGTLTVRSLAPGEEVTLSTFVTPQSVGRYYYGACIDEMPGDPGTPVDCRSGDSVTVSEASPGEDSADIQSLGCRYPDPFGFVIQVNGTVHASEHLSQVRVIAYGIEGTSRTKLGDKDLGSMSAGEKKKFSINGINRNYTSCAAVLELQR